MSDFPSSWAQVPLHEIASTTSGGTPSRSRTDFYGGSIPWVKSGELNDGMVEACEETLTAAGIENSSAKLFPAGTLCVALYGATVGKLGILGMDAATNQAVCGISPAREIETKYLFYYLLSQRSNLINQSQGGAQPNISQGIIRSTQVPICSWSEQVRIVAEIEKQFTRLDAAATALRRVQANLKRYRASVLKAACEGRLVATEAELARKEHRDYEPANELLKRILCERRARWEADTLAKMAASGKRPTDDRWKQKYKEPSAPDATDLPNLPKGWSWVHLDAIAFVTKLAGFEYTKFVRYDTGGDLRVIKAENVSPRGFRSTEFSRVRSETVAHLSRSRLLGNDVMMVFVGVGLGQVARVPNDLDYFLGPNVALIRIESPEVLSEYVELYLRSPLGFEMTKRHSKATAQGSISMSEIRRIPCAIPALSEQKRIVAEAARLGSEADAAEVTVATQIRRAETLRQSVLRDAFTGHLVPQCPTDEPASVLLDRIRNERAAQASPAGSRKRRELVHA